ncbi:MAG: HAMP domain-containing sensor histidine kinase [Candidatus Margulisiibacteriota bacterium]|nr:HAMP domain-containing sensor histidine kinase [Candidatus Margulisiibacteriota bacterium]
MKFNFKLSLKTKLTFLLAAIIFVFVSAISYDYYKRSETALMKSLHTELKQLAVSLSFSINPQTVADVLEGDEISPKYRKLKEKLHSFTMIANRRINGAYILVPTKKRDIWEFVADNEMRDRDQMAVLHEEYNVNHFPQIKNALLTPSTDKNITTDRWGQWISGYAPIYDNHGRPYAVIGIDMKANEIKELQRNILDTTLFYFTLGILFALLVGRYGAVTITKPIEALSKGIRNIQDKEYNTQIDIHRTDEIGELIHGFNQMAEKLSEIDKIKSDFLSVISHELYTPLVPILGGAAILYGKPDLPDKEKKRIIASIKVMAEKMRELVDDLLDFSWLDIENIKLEKEPINLKNIAQEVVTDLSPPIQKKEIDLSVNINPNLLTVMGDKKRLKHVLKILLDNAIKFSSEKGKISLSINNCPEGVAVIIQDSGIGMKQGELDIIFESFYQIEDHLTRTHGGMGIGLAIAKRIIEAHEGIIRAESEGLGKGARFVFTLPPKS